MEYRAVNEDQCSVGRGGRGGTCVLVVELCALVVYGSERHSRQNDGLERRKRDAPRTQRRRIPSELFHVH